ncbi:phage holin [Psychrobacillus soli]|uniref:Phage holin n=1 Tax=Psychrobacillus soli TaxID=1543965 RepID=A0A544TK19_9BACI|nr:phage holin [Psychrobacillus soli]TQR17778.1 phage holin [Psychrobacillus soli]
MKINWKVRFKNKIWVTGFIAQIFLLAELLLIGAHAASLTDFHITEEMKDWIFAFINIVFGLLATMGIIQEPTTNKLPDSKRAMNYIEPK